MNILFTTLDDYTKPHGHWKKNNEDKWELYYTKETLSGSVLVVKFDNDAELETLYEQEKESVLFAVRLFLDKIGTYPDPNGTPLAFSGKCQNFPSSNPSIINVYLETIHWTQNSNNNIHPPPLTNWNILTDNHTNPPPPHETPQNDPLNLTTIICPHCGKTLFKIK